MDIATILKEYREACSLTQQMLVNEIEIESIYKVKISVPIINGIEHGSSVINPALSTYLQKKFLYLDKTVNDEIVTLSFKLAEYYAVNNIELNIGKIFSFLNFTEFCEYLKIDQAEFKYTEKEQTLLYSLDTEVNISFNYGKIADFTFENHDFITRLLYHREGVRLNDASIFIINFTFWYILKYKKKENFELKSSYPIDFLSEIANIFGYENYTLANDKVRGKVLRYISRRISLYEFFINIPSIKNFLNSAEEEIEALSNAYSAENEKNKQDKYQEERKKLKDILENNNFNKEEAINYFKTALQTTNILSSILLMMYSVYQGNYCIVSKKEIYRIYDRFIIEGLFENNNIREKIETFKRDFETKYNEFIKGNFEMLPLLFQMQKEFYKIYKYHYLAKQSLSKY